MFNSSGIDRFLDTQCFRCPHCGRYCHPQEITCPQCKEALPATIRLGTKRLGRRPFTLPIPSQGNGYFGPETNAILQFLPSGVCHTLALKEPLILGRATYLVQGEMLDLTEHNAYQHGVSRLHCMLRRQGTRLVVTDLGSANGTHLNGEPILPHKDYLLSDSDQLILGSLHLTVFFSTSKAG
jgi:hypothetical protein